MVSWPKSTTHAARPETTGGATRTVATLDTVAAGMAAAAIPKWACWMRASAGSARSA